MVNPFMPGSMYKGADHQQWQRERANLAKSYEKPPAPKSSGGSSLASPSAPSYAGGGGSGGGPGLAGAVGEGVAGAVGGLIGASRALGAQSGALAGAVVERVGPLRALTQLGVRICGAGKGVRLFLAVPCALVGAAVGFGAGGQDAALGLVGAAVGGGVGWALPTVLGLVITLAAHLTGLAIGLGAIALVLIVAYAAIRTIAG